MNTIPSSFKYLTSYLENTLQWGIENLSGWNTARISHFKGLGRWENVDYQGLVLAADESVIKIGPFYQKIMEIVQGKTRKDYHNRNTAIEIREIRELNSGD